MKGSFIIFLICISLSYVTFEIKFILFHWKATEDQPSKSQVLRTLIEAESSGFITLDAAKYRYKNFMAFLLIE